MPLSDLEIWAEIHANRLQIVPLDEERVKAHTIDLRLGNHLLLLFKREDIRGTVINPQIADVMSVVKRHSEEITLSEGQVFPLEPGRLVLAKTLERVALPHYLAARVEGKSGFARVGLQTHVTAPIIHPGFDNVITLELINNGPFDLLLAPGMDIAQLVIERLGSPVINPYQGRFQSQQ